MSLCKEITTTTTTKQLRWFNLTHILHVLTAVGTGRYVPRFALESNGKTEKQLQQINCFLQKKQGSSDKYVSFSALFFFIYDTSGIFSAHSSLIQCLYRTYVLERQSYQRHHRHYFLSL